MAQKRQVTSKLKKDSAPRQLPSNTPGRGEKRTPKALQHAESLLQLREQLAANVKWLLENSAAAGSIPRMAKDTGLGINTIRRVLNRKGGTTLDTVYLLAASYGLAPHVLFDPLTDRDMRMVQMMEGMKREIAELQAKAGP